MPTHNCPICRKRLKFIERYPRYVCGEFISRVTDKDGRSLSIYNVDFTGGDKAIYKDTEEEYDSHICYIYGIKCYADEARFGGIVVLVK